MSARRERAIITVGGSRRPCLLDATASPYPRTVRAAVPFSLRCVDHGDSNDHVVS